MGKTVVELESSLGPGHSAFEYTDANGDGIVRGNEVKYLEISGAHFVNGCSEPWDCTLDLTYSLGTGALQASAYIREDDWEHMWYTMRSFDTTHGYSINHSGMVFRGFAWRDYTTISVSAVPESTSVSMLLAGLAGTALALRRRKQS